MLLGGIHVLVSIGTSKSCDVILFDDVTIQCTLNYACYTAIAANLITLFSPKEKKTFLVLCH